MASCRRRRRSTFTAFSFACHLVRTVCRSTVNFPFRVFPPLCVKPRTSKLSGRPSPRPRRLTAAKRPNCRVSPNRANRSRSSGRNGSASSRCSNPTTTSSAKRTTTTSPRACFFLHRWTGRRGSLRLRRMTLSFTAPRRCDRRTETTMTLLESLSTDLRRLHDVLDKSLDGLTTDQLHTVPAGHPKANTIAWNLWHYARTEDNVVRFVLQDRRPTVWVEGGYPERLGLHPAARGTGTSAAEAHALRIRDLPPFAGYMKKVWPSTGDNGRTLSTAEPDRKGALKFVGEMPVARVFAMVGITHGFTHFGEIELARTLVGARSGGAT